MVELFGAGVSGDGDFFDVEVGAAEVAEEGGLDAGGPEGDDASRGESAFDEIDASAFVDLGVVRLKEGGGAVVDIEKDGVVARGFLRGGFFDEFVDVGGEDLCARIGEDVVVEAVEMFFVPFDDLGEEFGDFDGGIAVGDFEGAAHPKDNIEALKEMMANLQKYSI